MPTFRQYSSPGTCLWCGQRFTGGPARKRFCCPAHRQAFRREQTSRLPKVVNDHVAPAMVAFRRERIEQLRRLADQRKPLNLPLPPDLLD